MFWNDGELFRQVNASGAKAFERLSESGLERRLLENSRLIPHRVVNQAGTTGAYKVLQPELVPFISYPYEWSFSQLKEAALVTLEIQKTALNYGMTLRDASAYNIQLFRGQLSLIDTLSFDIYQPGRPWQAYRQFCQHFLVPLALMSYIHPDLLQLGRVYIDGVPLSLTAKMLPLRSRLRPAIGTHISLQAGLQHWHRHSTAKSTSTVSRTVLDGLIDSLERLIKSLQLSSKTEWSDYYQDNNYSEGAFKLKGELVADWTEQIGPRITVDLGSNNGWFSRLAARGGGLVISTDNDPLAVDQNYRSMRAQGETNLVPLLVDLANPSPALGWANQERSSFTQRSQSDLVLALALVHHLAIGNNLPLTMMADYMAGLGPNLIIEFVPKTDSQVQRLLATREDIFTNYTQVGFETAFKTRFKVIERKPLNGSDRVMYRMQRI